jgi:3-hydroxyisobutyryl-CoA hydrolase
MFIRSFSRLPKAKNLKVDPLCRFDKFSRRMSSQTDDGVVITEYGKIKHVLLNRPKALNALDLPMIRKLTPYVKKWANESGTILIMKGAGDKAFCAGGDIRAIYDSEKSGGTLSRDFFREEYILNYALAKQNVVQVSLLNGITMGGGVGLSVHGKYRVATENTLFAMPETAIGFFCDVGGTILLSRLGALGMYLALTGTRLKGKEVVSAGVATHFVEAAKLDQLEQALLKTSNASQTLQQMTESNVATPSAEFVELKDVINQTFSLDHSSVETIVSKLQNVSNQTSNQRSSAWAKRTLETLNKMSPTSLKVVHRQLRQGRTLEPYDCFKMEYRISQRFMKGANSDFFEGVRAVLVDKDKNPKWNPPTLEQVTDKEVASFFQPVENDLILEPGLPSKL